MSERAEASPDAGSSELMHAREPASGEPTVPSEPGTTSEPGTGGAASTVAPDLDTAARRSAADRGRHRTTANMARSLLPLLALIMVGVWLLQARGDDSASSSSQFRAAQARAGTALPQPRGLEAGWRRIADSADVPAKGHSGPVTWTVRFQAPDGKTAQAVISTRPLSTTLHQTAPRIGAAKDTVLASGRRWSEYRTAAGAPLLGTTIGKLSAVVSGSETLDGLVTLAGSLR